MTPNTMTRLQAYTHRVYVKVPCNKHGNNHVQITKVPTFIHNPFALDPRLLADGQLCMRGAGPRSAGTALRARPSKSQRHPDLPSSASRTTQHNWCKRQRHWQPCWPGQRLGARCCRCAATATAGALAGCSSSLAACSICTALCEGAGRGGV